MTMNAKTVGQAVVEALAAERVEFVFGLAGSHVLHIFDALAEHSSIRHVVTKHENNASLMAGMYGRLTGRPGVAVVTAGPGAVNSLSGVAQAYTCALPMIHISGTVPLGSAKETFHGVDKDDFLCKMFLNVAKWSVRVERQQDVPEVMSRAFTMAITGRPGPVHIEIPMDVLEADPVEMPAYDRQAPAPAAPGEDLVADVADLLWEAEHPVIFAGKGVLAHRATEQLATLADAVSTPVTFPHDALGVIPTSHPLCAGMFSSWDGDPLATDLVASADMVLAVGLRAGTETANHLTEHTKARIAHIGFDDETAGGLWEGARVSAVVDCRLFLEKLVGMVRTQDLRDGAAVRKEIAEYRLALKRGFQAMWDKYRDRKPVHFGLAVAELGTRLQDDAIVVRGVGNHTLWGRQILPVRHPFGHVQEGTWGTMGSELPGAIAAKLVFPERQVVALTGDGSFLMSCSDFCTAMEVGANIIVFILNDSGYGMIKGMQERRFGRAYGAGLWAPNFARFAESFGAAGVRVEDPHDLSEAVHKAVILAEETPVIVDIVSDSCYPVPRLGEIAGHPTDLGS
jgi:acetolactate synthase-1/2/3 large subunit